MKKIIIAVLICLNTALLFTGCTNNSVNVNVENDTTINGTKFGKSALLQIGDGLWYDTTTLIVYWWNGRLSDDTWRAKRSNTTPSPYYAPNGLPYRYNPETNTFEEIDHKGEL